MSMSVVLVDAGYLYAQGSLCLAGSQLGRADIRINESAVVRALKSVSHERSGGCGLLRIYWYDAPLRTGITAQQAALANSDHIKLRLGVLNGLGQQKGVDSLIVSDLIELARNRAISDAILVSGDEDVRIAVQIAQAYGVRIHLLGMHPARASQSALLRQEADTTSEWTTSDISMFMSVTPKAPRVERVNSEILPEVEGSPPPPQAALVTEAVDALGPQDVADLAAYWTSRTGLPPEIDRPLLARCRDALARDLAPDERRNVRRWFETLVRGRGDYPGEV